MRTLTRLLTRSATTVQVIWCESCGQACTPACRALARADRERTTLLCGRAR